MTRTVTDIQTMAEDFTLLLEKNDFIGAIERYYAQDILSVEQVEKPGYPKEAKGYDEVLRLNKEWMEQHDVHEMRITGPYVGKEQFALYFYLDVTIKAANQRFQMDEMALYDVKDGKIVKSHFFYNAAC